jgi:hypothetical protein
MLRDPGLHGADTTTRTQTVAQIKWCANELDPLCDEVNPSMGNARLRLVLRTLATSVDECDPCADELGLNEAIGNYLFRVEIHDVHYDDDTRPDEVVLKWSSENGAEAYNTSDVPPDFSANQYVYEYFDDVTEKRLGNHLARDAANTRIIDGLRPDISDSFSAESASAKDYVRRWDGWCRIVKSGSDWQVTEGFEGEIDLGSVVTEGNPGHVVQGGDTVTIELRVITQIIELADFDMIAGDYWTVPVRETVHQQGEVLLQGDVPGEGATPEGEQHHYMLLLDVANDESNTMQLPPGSDCDDYNACQLPQFPSLTDLRADDICYDNQQCEMPEVSTVQGALDYLCQQNDLPWHNKHLHGWGIVCGLALECNKKEPQTVILQSGYALDCEGRDMILNQTISINVFELMKEAGINHGDIDRDKGQGLCLFLQYTQNKELDVGIELYQSGESDWTDIFTDTLLMDFFQDCILDLVAVFTKDLQKDDEVIARCAVTKCGEKLLEPVRRRGLAIANLVYNDPDSGSTTVLNVSPCEHALLKDLYEKLKDYLRSKTFCAQFNNNDFPDYPFKDKDICRGTWFTPENLDHIRQHPDGQIIFGWQRSSSRIFVFKQSKKGCIGDLLGFIEVPKLEDGTITDLVINDKGVIYISAIVHQEDTMILRGQFVEKESKSCEIKIEWQDSFICGVKITNLELSPWSSKQLYAVALCKGVYLFVIEKLFENEKIEKEPDWMFLASGHIKFDRKSNMVLATAYDRKAGKGKLKTKTCANGYYNGIVLFNGKPSDKTLLPDINRFFINDNLVQGNDGFDISPSTEVTLDDNFTEAKKRLVSDLHVYVVINENDKKILCRFDLSGIKVGQEKQKLWFGVKMHSFGVAKKVSLRYINEGKIDGVLASRFAMHDLQYIPVDPKRTKKESLLSIPVQAGPVEIITNDSSKQIFILNHMGQSLSVFNYALPVYQKERDILAKYRADVLAAFYSLAFGIIQYLKDCFCHHLLVKCPECDEDDKVYLGCLSIEDNEVYHICNFTKRKYVKTFPTVSYWLSIIPVEGLISWAVENICCFIMPDYARKKPAAQLTVSPLQMSVSKAAVQADPGNIITALSTKGGDLLNNGISRVIGMGFKNKTSYQDTLKLEYNYKPGVFVDDKATGVTNEILLEQMGAIDQARLNNTQNVDQLSVNVEKLQQEKAEVEAYFATLDVEKQAAETKVSALEKEILELRTETVNSARRFAELEKGISALEAMRKEIQPVIEGAKPVSTIEGISDKNISLLEENNINTVSSLATMSQEKLVEMGIQSRTAGSLIKKANGIINLKSGK